MTKKLISTSTLALLALAFGMFFTQPARAASGSWGSAISGNWSLATNWTGSTIADATGSTATFSVDLAAGSDLTVNLDSARTLAGLVFGDIGTTTSANWILNNAGNSANILTLDAAGSIVVNAMGAGSTATISTVLAGAATSLTKGGVGTLVLSGANTISGALTIGNNSATSANVGGGILRLDSGGSLTVSTLTIRTISTNSTGSTNAGLILNGGTLLVTGATSFSGGAGIVSTTPVRNLIEVDSGSATFTGAFSTTIESATLKITGGTTVFNSTLNFFKSAGNSGSDPTGHSIDFSGTAGGLIVNNGSMTVAGNVILGAAAGGASMLMTGGNVTLNSGLILSTGTTANRGGGLRVTGGTFTLNDTARGIVLVNAGTVVGYGVTEFAGGTSTVGKFSLAGATSAGAGLIFVDGGALYVGAGGIALPSGTSTAPGTYVYTVKLGGSGFTPANVTAGAAGSQSGGGTQFTGQGILGAAASWSSAVNMVVAGNSTILNAGNSTLNFTIKAADASGTTHDIALNGVLSGTGGFEKTGPGKLTLGNASNSFSGNVIVSNGTLSVAANGALGSGALYLGGGTLQATGAADLTLSKAIQIAAGNGTFQNSLSSGNVTLTGGIAKNGNNITFTGTNLTKMASAISGGADVIVDAGNLQYTVAQTYSGPTFVRNGGTLSTTADNVMPTGPRTALTLDNSGTGSSHFNLGGNDAIASLTGASLSVVGLGTKTLTFGTTSGSTNFAGNITGTGSIVKDGASKQILTHANTFSGGTTISGGTLGAGMSGALGSGPLNISGGSTLQLTASGVTLSLGALTIGTGGGTLDFGSFGNGEIDFAAHLTGSSNLTLLNYAIAGDKLRFGLDGSGLTTQELTQIVFGDGIYSGKTAGIDSSGFITALVPEPAEVSALFGLAALLMVRCRRNRRIQS